jgi:hypothetical protein
MSLPSVTDWFDFYFITGSALYHRRKRIKVNPLTAKKISILLKLLNLFLARGVTLIAPMICNEPVIKTKKTDIKQKGNDMNRQKRKGADMKEDKFENCRQYSRWMALLDQQNAVERNNSYRRNLRLWEDTPPEKSSDDKRWTALFPRPFPELKDDEALPEHVHVTTSEYHVDYETYKQSNEVPVNQSFYDMGLTEYTNPQLDESQEGRYLREYCVQRAGANHFLHMRLPSDLKSRHEHLDPDKLMYIFKDDMPLPYDVAYKWAETNRKLGIDRKMFLKMVHGEMKELGVYDKAKYIEKLEEMAEEADVVTVKWINYINSDNVEQEYLKQFMNTVNFAEDEESWEYWDELIEPLYTYTQFGEDGLDRKESTNPYSTNRLFNGTETLSWDFQMKIMNADIKEIRRLQSNMFPQERTWRELLAVQDYFKANFGTIPTMKSTNKRTKPLWKKCKLNMKSSLFRYKKPVYDEEGYLVRIPAVTTGLKYKRPVFHYFTPGMVSHFWTLVKLRKEQLNHETMEESEMSESGKVAMEWIRNLGKGAITCRVIECAIKGQAADVYGIKIKFKTPMTEEETNMLWQTYKNIKETRR